MYVQLVSLHRRLSGDAVVKNEDFIRTEWQCGNALKELTCSLNGLLINHNF